MNLSLIIIRSILKIVNSSASTLGEVHFESLSRAIENRFSNA